MLKKSENNGTEEIGLVTLTPDSENSLTLKKVTSHRRRQYLFDFTSIGPQM